MAERHEMQFSPSGRKSSQLRYPISLWVRASQTFVRKRLFETPAIPYSCCVSTRPSLWGTFFPLTPRSSQTIQGLPEVLLSKLRGLTETQDSTLLGPQPLAFTTPVERRSLTALGPQANHCSYSLRVWQKSVAWPCLYKHLPHKSSTITYCPFLSPSWPRSLQPPKEDRLVGLKPAGFWEIEFRCLFAVRHGKCSPPPHPAPTPGWTSALN